MADGTYKNWQYKIYKVGGEKSYLAAEASNGKKKIDSEGFSTEAEALSWVKKNVEYHSKTSDSIPKIHTGALMHLELAQKKMTADAGWNVGDKVKITSGSYIGVGLTGEIADIDSHREIAVVHIPSSETRVSMDYKISFRNLKKV